MRTFYIFEIKSELKKMLSLTPYELFHTLETIYYEMNSKEDSYMFLKQLINPINAKVLDMDLYNKYKDNYFYTKYQHTHNMHDVYRSENTTLRIFKTYMLLETNVIKPRFLEQLQKNSNLFFCDFAQKDYFFLDTIEQVCYASQS